MRRDIQGLRAVAVLLVVVFHLWPNRLPGGYLGVDVFFVISGFLITAHLLREADTTGSVRLGEFWARRIRRLLPAAYLVLLVSAAGVLVWVPRVLWRQFLGEVLAAGLYVENWALALNSVDYLAADNTPSPAQHYWTLSAEEQFYLLWPLLVLLGLWVARRRGPSPAPSSRRGVLAVLSLATGASLAYSLWVTASRPDWAYFVTPARAWEFGAGALLAFVPGAAGRLTRGARAVLGSAAGAALLVLSLVLDEHTPMPGTAAIWVVLASSLVIWTEPSATRWSPARLLTTRPAVLVGDVSYSAYLWHWPLVILLPHVTGHDLRTAEKVGILAATLVLAAATTRWVEDPVRRGRRLGLTRVGPTLAWAAAGALVVTAVCVVPRAQVAREAERTERVARRLAAEQPPCYGAASRDPSVTGCPDPELRDVVVPAPEAAAADYPQYGECYAQMMRSPLVPCHFGERRPGVPHVAVIGDSHARVLMTAVERLVDSGLLTADLIVSGGCPWSTTPVSRATQAGRQCMAWRSDLGPLLARTAKDYDAVLTTARLTTMRGPLEQRAAGLADAWRQVTRQGVPVVVVRDNPQAMTADDDPNLCLAGVPAVEANARCSVDRRLWLDRWYDALADAAKQTDGARLLDLTPYYCDADRCPVVIGGVDVYADNNHLTVTYARTLAPYLYRGLVGLGALPG